MSMGRFLTVILFVAVYQNANADWADPGAVYLCDKKAGVFSMKPIMDTISPEDPGTVATPPRYRAVQSAKHFKCVLGHIVISAHFEVDGPHATGTCAGFTHTYIRSLSVNGKPIITELTSFNSACFSDPELDEIEIKKIDGKIRVELCYATWDWGVGYTKTKCDSQTL